MFHYRLGLVGFGCGWDGTAAIGYLLRKVGILS